MRNALVALTTMAIVSGAALISSASAAPMAPLSGIETGTRFETVAAHKRTARQAARQSSGAITSFSSSSSSAGVNHPPKR
jgi:hypothetical protein